MRITDVEIANFRSISSLRLNGLGRAVVFYGRNGAGKSNIIAAIAAAVKVAEALARSGLPKASSNATAVGDAVRPADFRVQGDGTMSLGLTVAASEKKPIFVIDTMPVTRLEFRVVVELRPGDAPVAWCSKLLGRIGKTNQDVDLAALMRGDEKAVPATWPVLKEGDNARKRERMAAIANVIQPFIATKLSGPTFRVVSDLRHLGAQSSDARNAGDIPSMLAAGDLKGAFAAAHQHIRPDVRDRFLRLRKLLSEEPLSLPEFDPVRVPNGMIDVQTRLPGGAAVSIDLSGLGVQQLFYIVASIALDPALSVAIEEPEAHLHAPTSGRALRSLLASMLAPESGMVDQLFVATHSNLFDLDPNGYWNVEIREGATHAERRSDLASIDRDHLWEPGPAKHALEDIMRVLPADTVVARRPDGAPVTAAEMVASLQSDDDVAKQFCDDVIGAAVRAVRVRAATSS